jgi:hypothetical protein
MGSRVDIDFGPDPGVGQSEPDCVIDFAGGDLVSVKQKGCDGQPAGIRAGALLASSRGGIHAVQIPNREELGRERAIGVGRFPCLIEFLVNTIGDNEMAIRIRDRALVSWLSFHAAASGQRNCGHKVGISVEESRALSKRNKWCARASLDNPQTEISLHSSKTPSAYARKPGDDLR